MMSAFLLIYFVAQSELFIYANILATTKVGLICIDNDTEQTVVNE